MSKPESTTIFQNQLERMARRISGQDGLEIVWAEPPEHGRIGKFTVHGQEKDRPTIYIKPGMSAEKTLEVVLHECGHATQPDFYRKPPDNPRPSPWKPEVKKAMYRQRTNELESEATRLATSWQLKATRQAEKLGLDPTPHTKALMLTVYGGK